MKYLLAIALGPVQDFIAAARRTADLKAGSELLSQVVGEVARHLQNQHRAKLIYPADIEQPSAPNRILCVVECDKPHKVAQEAHQNAQDYLENLWLETRRAIAQQMHRDDENLDFEAMLDPELPQHQITNFLEFYAAWVPLSDDYAESRRQVERLLAARKATREFKQPPICPKRPKSPLDPALDCAFKDEYLPGFALSGKLHSKPPLYLKPRETLDTISLIKRYRGYKETRKGDVVPSTTEMGFRALQEFLHQESRGDLLVLEEWTDKLPGVEEISALIHQNRWQRLKEERRNDPRWRQFERDFPELERAASAVRGRLSRADIPEEYLSYYAVLLADGDRMGQFLDTLTLIEQHQEFSKTLGEFAGDAKDVVNRHEGYLVYAGGDDVLALLPANRAIACARELAQRFNHRMGQFCQQHFADTQASPPTLSAGIAIVHALEHLQSALNWARAAEKTAKDNGRDSLAVTYYPRSGEAITVAMKWSECDAWNVWERAFRQGLAGGLPYELLQLAREYESLSRDEQRALIPAEVERVIQRKEGRQHAPPLPALETVEQLRHLARLMIIARMLAVYPEVNS